MTVSADGNFVLSDPGVGIREPGWHGTQPGTSVDGGEIEADCEPTGCTMGPIRITRLGPGRFRFSLEGAEHTPGIVNWFAATASNAQGLSGDQVDFLFCEAGPHNVTAQLSPRCGDPCSKAVSVTVPADEVNTCEPGSLGLRVPAGGFLVGQAVSLDLITASGTFNGEVDWTVTGGTPASGRGRPFVTRFCQPGNFAVKWKVTTPCGRVCEGADTLPVSGQAGCTLKPLTLFGPPTALAGEALSVVSEAGQEGTVEWDAGDGELLLDRSQAVGSGGVAGVGIAQTIQFCTPGAKTIRARLTTACGQTCEQSITVTVTGQSGCLLDPLYAFGQTTILAGEAASVTTAAHQAGTVVWSGGDGELLLDASQSVGTAGVAGLGAAQTVRFCTPGTKTLTATLTTDCGQTCQQSITIQVTENPCNFDPLSAFGTTTILAGETLSVTTQADVEGTFVWETPGGEALLPVTQNLSPSGIAGFGAAQSITYGQPGTFTIRGILTTSCGDRCSRELVVTVLPVGPSAMAQQPTGASAHPILQAFAQPQSNAPGPGLAGVQPRSIGLATPRAAGGPPRVRQSGMHYYILINPASGAVVRRGFAGRNGVAHARPLIVGANRNLREMILQADSFWVASQDFRTGENGTALTLKPFVLAPPPATDADQDGIPDAAEFIVGTDPNDADSDDDGINDAEETRAGTALSDSLGVIASVRTPGNAVDVAADGDLLALALKEAGVAVFNIFGGLAPAMIAQVSLPGEATAVAVDGTTVVVGCHEAGLAVVDVTDPTAAAVRAQLNLRAPVRSVAARAGLAYAGLDSGEIVLVDLTTGTESARINLGRPIHDLVLAGHFLYALTPSELAVLALANGGLELRNTVPAPGSVGAGGRRLRLFAGGGLAYAVDTQGFAVFDLSTPDLPAPMARQDTAQFGWKQLVPTGTGVALAAVGANSTDDGNHDVSLYDLQPGSTNATLNATFTTPGLAEAVTLAGGLGYVADGRAGLQVVRFLPRDTARRAPTVALVSPFAAGQAEESKPATFTARVADDVQVGRVEFFVDGRLVDTDSSFPFELRITTPDRTPQKSSFTLRARAVDTGGNSASSEELRLELTLDATPPAVVRLSPASGNVTASGPVSRIALGFSEAIQPGSLPRERLRVVHAGADGRFGTADDQPINGGSLTYQPETFTALLIFESLLLKGNVRVTLNPGVADLTGNARPEAFTWSFTVGGPRVVATTPASGGNSAGRALVAAFNGPIAPGSLEGRFTLTAAGADGRFNTADDTLVPGGVLKYDPEASAATLVFEERLVNGKYRAEIDAQVADAAGNTIGNPTRWEFTVLRGSVTAQAPFTAIVSVNGFGNTSELLVHLPGGLPISFFAPLDFGDCATWSLFDPNGRPVFEAKNLCAFPLVLTPLLPGDYSLQAVSSSIGGGRSRLTASVHQRRVFEASLVGQDTLERTSGARVVGDVDIWELTLPPGEKFAFALGSILASWSLRDLAGRVLFEDEQGREVHVPEMRAGGLFRLEIAPRSASGYQFKITRTQTRRFAVDLREAVQFDSLTNLPNGHAIQRVPGDVDLIEFTIKPGDRWVFIPQSSFPCFDWSLLGPDRKSLFGPISYCSGSQPSETGGGGVFTLRLTPEGGQSGGYRFQAWKAVERVIDVDLRATARFDGQGNLQVPGSVDRYRLRINSGDAFRFVGPQFGNCLPWELRSPAGAILFQGSACSVTEQPDLAIAGIYELRVSANDNRAGDYKFIIAKPGTTRFEHDLRTQPSVSFEEDLVIPGSIHVHQLTLQPDSRLFLNVSPILGGGGGFANLASVRSGLGALAANEPGSGLRWSLVEEGGAAVVAERDAVAGDVFLEVSRSGKYLLTIVNATNPQMTRYAVQLNTVRSAPGRWLPVPATGAPTGDTTAVAVMGDAVFVAGQFAAGRGVGRLRAGAWTFLGTATRDGETEANLFALATDGTNLFAGGNFTSMNGVAARGVAQWNGTAWEALGEGVDTSTAAGSNFEVRALGFFNNELVAGGRFRRAGTVEAKNLARWNRTQWQACPLNFPIFGLTQGIGGRPANDTGEIVNALALAQGVLRVGGEFQFPGRNVAGWNGSAIVGGPGLQQSGFDGGAIFGLAGQGNDLFAVGRFTRPEFGSAFGSPSVARWDGTQWNAVGLGMTREPLTIAAGASGLFLGGDLRAGGSSGSDGTPANGIVRFDGTHWFTLQLGVQRAAGSRLVQGQIQGLALNGNQVLAVGQFEFAGGEPAPHFAIWQEGP